MLIRKIIKNQSGAAFIELSFILPFLMLAFIGMIEIISFIKIKERMNKTAAEVAGILSTIPSWNVGQFIEPSLPAARLAAKPYGVSISARFCQLGGTRPFTSANFGANYTGTGKFAARPADCSLGKPSAGVLAGPVNCTDAPATAISQYVVVSASCLYSPILSQLGLFKNQTITSYSFGTMRYSMIWN